MYSYKNSSPTKLYYEILNDINEKGDELAPRGKKIKELRPVSVEFENAYKRVSFLPLRRINPFFQMAESWAIVTGMNDAQWLANFNKNMLSFSDDGKTFNAFYGERICAWGNNVSKDLIYPEALNQLEDAYKKFLIDKDTRQATVAIGNPTFDNYEYTVENKGLDIACNLYITFKIRHDKLNTTVFNRSNDCHWGLFGANLAQFTTIAEVLCSWLKSSGHEEFENLTLGTYCQLTDSLHIYTEDYGSKITSEVLDYYKDKDFVDPVLNFEAGEKIRMNSSLEEFNELREYYWDVLDKEIINPEKFCAKIIIDIDKNVKDPYWNFVFKSMFIYRLVKKEKLSEAITLMSTEIPNCEWKISMLYFLKNFIKKNSSLLKEELYETTVKSLVREIEDEDTKKYIEGYLSL